MHAIQGAMAVRRERQKRETRRLSQVRRHNKHGSGATPDGSQMTLFDPETATKAPKTESSLTAFHLGVVFILLGFLMVFSSMIPSSVVDADWSRLLGVGTTFIIVGLIMVMVNRIITAREEEELTRYVRHRLARTRSGHALVRDVESGDQLSSHLAAHQGGSRRDLHNHHHRHPSVNGRKHLGGSTNRGSIRRSPLATPASAANVPAADKKSPLKVANSAASVQNGKPSLAPAKSEAAAVEVEVTASNASTSAEAAPGAEQSLQQTQTSVRVEQIRPPDPPVDVHQAMVTSTSAASAAEAVAKSRDPADAAVGVGGGGDDDDGTNKSLKDQTQNARASNPEGRDTVVVLDESRTAAESRLLVTTTTTTSKTMTSSSSSGSRSETKQTTTIVKDKGQVVGKLL